MRPFGWAPVNERTLNLRSMVMTSPGAIYSNNTTLWNHTGYSRWARARTLKSCCPAHNAMVILSGSKSRLHHSSSKDNFSAPPSWQSHEHPPPDYLVLTLRLARLLCQLHLHRFDTALSVPRMNVLFRWRVKMGAVAHDVLEETLSKGIIASLVVRRRRIVLDASIAPWHNHCSFLSRKFPGPDTSLPEHFAHSILLIPCWSLRCR
jgi:hypothetical protein